MKKIVLSIIIICSAMYAFGQGIRPKQFKGAPEKNSIFKAVTPYYDPVIKDTLYSWVYSILPADSLYINGQWYYSGDTVTIATGPTDLDTIVGNEFGNLLRSTDSLFYRQCPSCSYSFVSKIDTSNSNEIQQFITNGDNTLTLSKGGGIISFNGSTGISVNDFGGAFFFTVDDPSPTNERGVVRISGDSLFYTSGDVVSEVFVGMVGSVYDGSETKAEAGDFIAISGTGTIGDPYLINNTAPENTDVNGSSTVALWMVGNVINAEIEPGSITPTYLDRTYLENEVDGSRINELGSALISNDSMYYRKSPDSSYVFVGIVGGTGESTTTSDGTTIDFNQTGVNITAEVKDGSITPVKLDRVYLENAINGVTYSSPNVKLGGSLIENTTITSGAYSMNFNRSTTNVDDAALFVKRTYAGTAPSPIATMWLQNDGETVGGSDYQNEVHLIMKAGSTSDHRKYINFRGYDNSDRWVFGLNGQNHGIWYDAVSTAHRLYFENRISGSGISRINSAGTGGVLINQGTAGENIGSGGLRVYDGVLSRAEYIKALPGNLSVGYATATTAGYRLNIGGTSYTTGQNGAIAIEAPTDINSNYTSWYGMRIFDVVSSPALFSAGIRSSMSAATSKYNLYIDGTANNYIAGNVGIGVVTPTNKLDVGTGSYKFASLGGGGVDKMVIVKSSGVLDTMTIPSAAPSLSYQNLSTNTDSLLISNGSGVLKNSINWWQKVGSNVVYSGLAKVERVGVPSQYTTFSGGDFNGAYWDAVGSNKNLIIRSLDSGGSAGANNGISFWTNTTASPQERMRLSTEGNLGIGISFPTSKLHVVGDVAVSNRTTGGTAFNLIGIGTANRIVDVTNGGGVSIVSGALTIDHGGIGGLSDDDHPQYHNDTRGDIRYYTKTLLNAGQLNNLYYTESEIDAALSLKQNNINVTTIGTSGAATWDGTTLNIPNYATSGGTIQDLSTNTDSLLISDGGTSVAKSAINFWLKNSSNLYYNSGNVGIGTSSPSYLADINNSSIAESFRITTGIDGRIVTFRGDYINFQRAGTSYISASNAAGGIVIGAGSAFKNDINITGGKIGIGNITPSGSSILDVNGTIKMRTGATTGYLIRDSGSGIMEWVNPSTLGIGVWTKSGNKVYPTAYTTDSVGINTISPTERLEVNGNIKATRLGVPGQYIQFEGGDFNGPVLKAVGSNKTLFINALDSDGSAGSNNAVVFKTGTTASPVERMRINYQGRVGIGTTSPVSALSITGDLSISNRTTGGTAFNLIGIGTTNRVVDVSLGTNFSIPSGVLTYTEADGSPTNELITSFTASGNSITIIEAGVSRGITAPNLATSNLTSTSLSRSFTTASNGSLSIESGPYTFLSVNTLSGSTAGQIYLESGNGSNSSHIDIRPTLLQIATPGEGLGTAGYSLKSGGGGSSSVYWGPDGTQINSYTSSSTWTKPTGCKTVTVTVIGGGGGGGGGSYIDNSTHNSGSGGGGGGAGGRSQETFDCTAITTTVTITVGSGGSGGPAQYSIPANGNSGSNGGQSSFGSYLKANGGGGGQGGQLSGTSTGGTAGLGSSCDGGAGGGSNNTATAGTTGEAARFASGGGNGGAGVTTSSGGANVSTTSPLLGTTGSTTLLGTGGSGAAAANTGGSPGNYGGGGGGGGAGRSATHIQGGAGASGAPGYVQVITHF